ncbi:uncharacterized protein SPPG_07232 [Spizellomyces punctatus DAOM BR117]|uniref:DAGKc domain-containing protein n=1 Tax=Spizellomyces punctatus (strain DAOM BR117) TaxID=645134 RepID=A0A0L0H9H2_SPIPD|nr:uncharacterized protein SPPG_07232 [Spizellomyces punctatus DAOM BR117]KNC97303.1 hypothetical protein SPPG_07232 [Spizellomyces punctatus DAOM BR117]|eukprot:XP_016605343.1 hypothetical protein SPPG_07232 [Spizellomyces punctatus DAOM BR117]
MVSNSVSPSADSERTSDGDDEQLTLIAIYNSRSGSRLAKKLAELPVPHKVLPNARLWCYNLRDTESFNRGLEHIQKQIELSLNKQNQECGRPRPNCWVLSCGGDGTVPAIVGALNERSVPVFSERVVFAVLPFGTANILARFLGWGSSMPKDYMDSLSDLIEKIVQAPVAMVDLMRVEVSGSKDRDDEAKQSHPDYRFDEPARDTHYMMLQVCIGLEARFGRFIEKHRSSSRICNMLISSFNVLRQLLLPHPHINHVISAIHSQTPSWSPTMLASHTAIQLNLQNIPVAGGKDHSLWNWNASADARHMPSQKIDDNKLEAFVYPCKHRYLVNNFLAAFRKETDVDALGQVECPLKIVFDTSQKDLAQTYVYIDGEYIHIQRPTELSIERAGQVALAIHPDRAVAVREFLSSDENIRDSAVSLAANTP